MNPLQSFDIPANDHISYCTHVPWYPSVKIPMMPKGVEHAMLSDLKNLYFG